MRPSTVGPATLARVDGNALSQQVLDHSSQEIPLAVSRVSLNPRYVTFSVFRRFL